MIIIPQNEVFCSADGAIQFRSILLARHFGRIGYSAISDLSPLPRIAYVRWMLEKP